MKFSVASLLVLLPLLSQAAAVTVPNLSTRQDNNRQRGGNRNNGGNNNNGNNNGGNNGGNAGTGGNPQTSLTLDPRVIAKGFANDGQDVPAVGQVKSLTSTNNFINFCLTQPSLPITDGKQITTGSCNPAPIGAIPSVDRMPSSKFTFPPNGGNVGANQPFTISMAINNLQTGNFVNAQNNYFAAPQQLNGQGTIIGHSHVVVEQLTSLTQTTPTDPRKFAFFKGLNGVAQGGVLTADVTSGLPAGAYRLCSINAAANHQPAIVPVAQHGSLDDCVYFTSGAAAGANNGGNNSTNGGNAGAGNGAAAGGAAGNNNGQNQNQGGGRGGKRGQGRGRGRRFFGSPARN
ncbi:hypothetical protein DXG03_001947 [Asterophora parasitica]|uniref:Ribosomal protein s17 n=1 Tax=Asterophora parasitica TaxID=117018 RepID=A0A9P7KCH3_9AGAR|nr:hypothetical protein DXG03_001947 [Asterophora parasitica]